MVSTWLEHAKYRAAIRDAISPKDIADVFKGLLKKAKGGDSRAAKLLIERMFGKVNLETLPVHWKRETLSKSNYRRKKDEKEEAIIFWKRIAADSTIPLDQRIKARDKLDDILGFKKIKVDLDAESLGKDIRDYIAAAKAQENNGSDGD